jgi:hypothetical protein
MTDTLQENDEQIDIIEDQEDGEHIPVESEQSDGRQYEHSDNDNQDDERQHIRERRRLEKIERKQRQDEARKRDKTELNFLQRRNEELERRFSAIEGKMAKSELGVYDSQINEARQRAALAEQVFAKAINAKNGEDAAKAMQYRDQARAAVQALEQRKAQEMYRMQQAQVQAQQAQNIVPARQIEMAQEFIKELDWYDPNGEDEDSAIVLALDASLVKAGYDPNSEEYWDELRDRVRKRLPEKFEKAAAAPQRSDTGRPRGGPQIGSGRNESAPSGRREVYISPERKSAMIEAGVWDDPVLRQKYIKRYMEYDKQNSR